MTISVEPVKDGPDLTGKVLISGDMIVRRLEHVGDVGDPDSRRYDLATVELGIDEIRQLSGKLPHVLERIEANLDADNGGDGA